MLLHCCGRQLKFDESEANLMRSTQPWQSANWAPLGKNQKHPTSMEPVLLTRNPCWPSSSFHPPSRNELQMFWGQMQQDANPVCNNLRRIILYYARSAKSTVAANTQVLLSCWQPSEGEEQHLMGPAALRTGERDTSKHPESPVPS